jgi:hypothetical protein
VTFNVSPADFLFYLCRPNSIIALIDKKNSIQKAERAVLVGLIHKTQTEAQSQEYLEELAFLAETAGAVTLKRFTQKMLHPDSKTFVGKESWRRSRPISP